ncbi:MAG TPA: Trm112 family protein [Blastocatellia bacterium]|nr:Trm112 family protein [Blastocatellia bacterium]
MSISPDLLEILACPACKAKIVLKADGSGLKCVECHRVYPIRDEIPVMLVDEATIEEENPTLSPSQA